MFRYILRVFRMVDLFARGAIDFTNFKQSLRPAQVAVLARKGGVLFCDSTLSAWLSAPTKSASTCFWKTYFPLRTPRSARLFSESPSPRDSRISGSRAKAAQGDRRDQ